MAAVATAATPVGATESAERRRTLQRRQAGRLFDPGRATLDERIAITWERLVGEGAVECPVCASQLFAGRPCASCGSKLS